VSERGLTSKQRKKIRFDVYWPIRDVLCLSAVRPWHRTTTKAYVNGNRRFNELSQEEKGQIFYNVESKNPLQRW